MLRDRVDDLLSLSLFHARIVSALAYQHRDFYFVGGKQRRRRGQQLLVLRVVRVADPGREERALNFPIRRERLQQREQIRRAALVDRASIDVGRECRAGESRIAAVRSAEYRDAL